MQDWEGLMEEKVNKTQPRISLLCGNKLDFIIIDQSLATTKSQEEYYLPHKYVQKIYATNLGLIGLC